MEFFFLPLHPVCYRTRNVKKYGELATAPPFIFSTPYASASTGRRESRQRVEDFWTCVLLIVCLLKGKLSIHSPALSFSSDHYQLPIKVQVLVICKNWRYLAVFSGGVCGQCECVSTASAGSRCAIA